MLSSKAKGVVVIKRTSGLFLLYILVVAGCSSSGKWIYTKLAEIPVEENVPGAVSCMDCHATEHETWKKTDHADAASMEKISVVQLRECGACHDNITAHLAAPQENKPQDITALSKSAQNQLCGKCHFNKDIFGWKSINPHHRHGLIMSVGFEGKKQQLSCLDCHVGHGGKGKMLERSQTNLCFKCHKQAKITMGIFQPFNYVAGGKVCTACHAPHGTSGPGHVARMTVGIAATCVPCHLP
jgi:predicted CXXCH cytochrome family protein